MEKVVCETPSGGKWHFVFEVGWMLDGWLEAVRRKIKYPCEAQTVGFQ